MTWLHLSSLNSTQLSVFSILIMRKKYMIKLFSLFYVEFLCMFMFAFYTLVTKLVAYSPTLRSVGPVR